MFGAQTTGFLNHCAGGLYVTVSASSATERSKFFMSTCCDFSQMQTEVAGSVKIQKTQHRMTWRTSGRKSKGVLTAAVSTLPPCETSQEKSLEHDQLQIIALLCSKKKPKTTKRLPHLSLETREMRFTESYLHIMQRGSFHPNCEQWLLLVKWNTSPSLLPVRNPTYQPSIHPDSCHHVYLICGDAASG